MSRITNSVSRAKAQLARVSDSMKYAKKEASDAYEKHAANLTRWHKHWNDLVNYRQEVLSRRIARRTIKKPASLDDQKAAFSGKMKNGMLLGKS